MTHDELIQRIMEIRGGSLLMHHHPDSRRDLGDRGLPDLIIVGHHGLIFAEIKGADGVLEPGQRNWGDRLKEVDNLCGPECERSGWLYFVWGPADWYSGAIRDQLDCIR